MLTVWIAALATAASAAETPAPTGATPRTGAEAAREAQLRGRVVTLTETANPVSIAPPAAPREPRLGFKTIDGRCYALRRTRYSEALFVDARLRKKELLLKGRLFPETRTFDVSSLRSIRNGVVCDLYYYCNVCSIKAIAPGPCLCCQQPVELVEQPLPEGPRHQ